MVVLLVIDPDRASVLEHGAVSGHPVWNPCQEFRQVERRVGVMTNTKEKHLSIQLVYPSYRAFRDVGWKRKWIGRDPGSFRASRREGLAVIAAQHTGQSPEGVSDNSQVWRRWSGHRVKGFILIPRPRGNH
jgi:hypothetical protein